MYAKHQQLNARAELEADRLTWQPLHMIDNGDGPIYQLYRVGPQGPTQQRDTYLVARHDPESDSATVVATDLSEAQGTAFLDHMYPVLPDIEGLDTEAITPFEDEALQQATAPEQAGDQPAARTPAAAEPVKEGPAEPVRFRPTSQEDLAPSGPIGRIRANIAAIRTLKDLQAANRPATADEQKVLARWSSWGAVPNIFDPSKAEYDDLRAELRALLTEEEWQAAEATVRNAHFTDASIVERIWEALPKLGLQPTAAQTLRGVDLGVGSGAFVGFAPEHVHMTGVELDPITAAIAAHLYPDATIRNESFADTRLPDGYFDFAIGNVPFDEIALVDPVRNPLHLATHNHAIVSKLQLTRPGGLVAVLTSRYTMDSAGLTARKEIAALGDLVGAVRLPTGAHRRAAGTEVVTDLLILRRRPDGAEPAGADFLNLKPVQLGEDTAVGINEYFVDHPEMVLGTHMLDRGRFSDAEVTVRAVRGFDLSLALGQALEAITASAQADGLTLTPVDPQQRAEVDATALRQQAAVEMFGAELRRFEGALVDSGNGTFQQVTGGELADRPVFKNAAEELSSLLALRDTYIDLLTAEATEGAAARVNTLRQQLNQRYDAHTARYGYLNKRDTRRDRRSAHGAFRTDPYAAGVYALEDYDFNADTAKKSDIFTKPVTAPRTTVTRADTPAEALALCLDAHGEVRLDYIAQLLQSPSTDAAREALGELVYQEPGTPRLVHADEYLSGDVREKLETAERLLRMVSEELRPDHPLQANVAALRRVLPEDVQPGDIDDVRLGVSWIGPKYVQEFLREILNNDYIEVTRTEGADWHVRAPSGVKKSAAATRIYGTEARNAIELAERMLRGQTIVVRPPRGDPDQSKAETRRLKRWAKDQTEKAQAKKDELNRLFSEWVWQDPKRTRNLLRIYNRQYNSWVDYQGDGAHLRFPGLSHERYTPRPHQRAFVARALTEPGGSFADHEVGFGKSLEISMTLMEMRRLGIARKPCLVVPNHLCDQARNDWLKAYPNARVLAVDSADFPKERRKEFVGRIANGEWDVVIMTQSVFEMIPMSASGQDQYVAGETDGFRQIITRTLSGRRDTATANLDADPLVAETVEDTIAQAQAAAGTGMTEVSKQTVKDLQGELKRLTQKLKKHLVKESDAGISWEQTGIDFIAVDEVQDYANLEIATRNSELSLRASARAAGLKMKLRGLERRHGPKVGLGATGTPFPNAMPQAYVQMDLFRPAHLKRAGLEDFDTFAAEYLQTIVAAEVSPEGVPRVKERIGGFRNAIAFSRLWRAFADVKTKHDITLPVPKHTAETVVVPATDEDRAFMEWIVSRAELVREGEVEPEEDNLLAISNDGRMGAMALQMVDWDPSPVGKLDMAADRIYAIWQANKDNRYTDRSHQPQDLAGALQLVFADRGTPSDGNIKANRFIAYHYLRDELVKRGMPAEAIRFIHEADDAAAKEELFKECREGKVAVLVGSTQKMGTGVNVQDRLVALHHLDCPWRPSDVTQREGRILRQFNQNEHVEILRYVQEGSFDSYMWQTVERKARFIDQIRTGRSVDELDEASGDLGKDYLEFGEIKAVATGNPLLLKKIKADEELRVLETAYNNWQRTEKHLKHLAENSGPDLERARDAADKVARAVQARPAPPPDQDDDVFRMETADGKIVDKRKDAAVSIRNALSSLRSRTYGARTPWAPIGILGGQYFEARIHRQQGFAEFAIKGAPFTEFVIDDIDNIIFSSKPPLGIVTRLENRVEGLPKLHARLEAAADEVSMEIERAKALVGKPFAKMEKLTKARATVAQLQAELEDAAEVSDEEEPDSAEAAEASDSAEQQPVDEDSVLSQLIAALADAGWTEALLPFASQPEAAAQQDQVKAAYERWAASQTALPLLVDADQALTDQVPGVTNPAGYVAYFHHRSRMAASNAGPTAGRMVVDEFEGLAQAARRADSHLAGQNAYAVESDRALLLQVADQAAQYAQRLAATLDVLEQQRAREADSHGEAQAEARMRKVRTLEDVLRYLVNQGDDFVMRRAGAVYTDREAAGTQMRDDLLQVMRGFTELPPEKRNIDPKFRVLYAHIRGIELYVGWRDIGTPQARAVLGFDNGLSLLGQDSFTAAELEALTPTELIDRIDGRLALDVIGAIRDRELAAIQDLLAAEVERETSAEARNEPTSQAAAEADAQIRQVDTEPAAGPASPSMEATPSATAPGLGDPAVRAAAVQALTAAATADEQVIQWATVNDLDNYALPLAAWADEWILQRWADVPTEAWDPWAYAYLQEDAAEARQELIQQVAAETYAQIRQDHPEPEPAAGSAAPSTAATEAPHPDTPVSDPAGTAARERSASESTPGTEEAVVTPPPTQLPAHNAGAASTPVTAPPLGGGIPMTVEEAQDDPFFATATLQQLTLAIFAGPYTTAAEVAAGHYDVAMASQALFLALEARSADEPLTGEVEQLRRDLIDADTTVALEPQLNPTAALSSFGTLEAAAARLGDLFDGPLALAAFRLSSLTETHLARMRAARDTLYDLLPEADALSADHPDVVATTNPLLTTASPYADLSELSEARREIFETYDRWPAAYVGDDDLLVPAEQAVRGALWALRNGSEDQLATAIGDWGTATHLALDAARSTASPETRTVLQDLARLLHRHRSRLRAPLEAAEEDAVTYGIPEAYIEAASELTAAWSRWQETATGRILADAESTAKRIPALRDAVGAQRRLAQALEIAAQPDAEAIDALTQSTLDAAHATHRLALNLRTADYRAPQDVQVLQELIAIAHRHAAAVELSVADADTRQAVTAAVGRTAAATDAATSEPIPDQPSTPSPTDADTTPAMAEPASMAEPEPQPTPSPARDAAEPSPQAAGAAQDTGNAPAIAPDLLATAEKQQRNLAIVLGAYATAPELAAGRAAVTAAQAAVTSAVPRRPRKRVAEALLELTTAVDALRERPDDEPGRFIEQYDLLSTSAALLGQVADNPLATAAITLSTAAANHAARMRATNSDLQQLRQAAATLADDEPSVQNIPDPVRMMPTPYAHATELNQARDEIFALFRQWPGSRRRSSDLADRTTRDLRATMRMLAEPDATHVGAAITQWSEALTLLLEAAEQRTAPGEVALLHNLARLVRQHATRLSAHRVRADAETTAFRSTAAYEISEHRLKRAREAWTQTGTHALLASPEGGPNATLVDARLVHQQVSAAMDRAQWSGADAQLEDLARHTAAAAHSAYALALTLQPSDYQEPGDEAVLHGLIRATYDHMAAVRHSASSATAVEVIQLAVARRPQRNTEATADTPQPTREQPAQDGPQPHDEPRPYATREEALADLRKLVGSRIAMAESTAGRRLLDYDDDARPEGKALARAFAMPHHQQLAGPPEPETARIAAIADTARTLVDALTNGGVRMPIALMHLNEIRERAEQMAARLAATATTPGQWNRLFTPSTPTTTAPNIAPAETMQAAGATRDSLEMVEVSGAAGIRYRLWGSLMPGDPETVTFDIARVTRGVSGEVDHRGTREECLAYIDTEEAVRSAANAVEENAEQQAAAQAWLESRAAVVSPEEDAHAPTPSTGSEAERADISAPAARRGDQALADERQATASANRNVARQPIPDLEGYRLRRTGTDEHAPREVLAPDDTVIARVTFSEFSHQWAGWVAGVPTPTTRDPLIAARNAVWMWAYGAGPEVARPPITELTSQRRIRDALGALGEVRREVLNAAARAWPGPGTYSSQPEIERLESAFTALQEWQQPGRLGQVASLTRLADDLGTLRTPALELRDRVAQESQRNNRRRGGQPSAGETEQWMAFPLIHLLREVEQVQARLRHTVMMVEERKRAREQADSPAAQLQTTADPERSVTDGTASLFQIGNTLRPADDVFRALHERLARDRVLSFVVDATGRLAVDEGSFSAGFTATAVPPDAAAQWLGSNQMPDPVRPQASGEGLRRAELQQALIGKALADPDLADYARRNADQPAADLDLFTWWANRTRVDELGLDDFSDVLPRFLDDYAQHSGYRGDLNRLASIQLYRALVTAGPGPQAVSEPTAQAVAAAPSSTPQDTATPDEADTPQPQAQQAGASAAEEGRQPVQHQEAPMTVTEPQATAPGPWSGRITLLEEGGSTFFIGTGARGFHQREGELRQLLKDERFSFRRGPANRAQWQYIGPYAARDQHIAAIRTYLAAKDREEAAAEQAAQAPKFPPTPQQQAIIDACAQGKDVVVQALAGTGKTSTLQMIADAMPDQKIIYIAFGNAVAAEAQRKFPRHVTAKTSHGFASAALRSTPLRDKVAMANQKKHPGAVRPEDVAAALGINVPLKTSDQTWTVEDVARLAMATVRSFRQSGDDTIGRQHLPAQVTDAPRAASDTVLRYARDAWADLSSPTSNKIKFTPDDYLKLWILSNPTLPGSVLLLDEAQDTNPALAALVKRQPHQKIVVGDSYQSIFGFRGAIDALKDWPADITLPLTQSWRFGPEPARVGNSFLQLLGGTLVLEGNPNLQTELGPVEEPDAILARTNAAAVNAVFEAFDAGKRVALVGGGGEIKAIAQAAKDLMNGRRTKHPELAHFKDWDEVCDYAQKEPDAKALETFVILVDRYGPDGLIAMAQQLVPEDARDEESRPEVVVSTAHKAKGREWDKVRITNDWPSPQEDPETEELVLPPAEILRLAYVTVTRARQRLELGGLDWIEGIGWNAAPKNAAAPTPALTAAPAAPVDQPTPQQTTEPTQTPQDDTSFEPVVWDAAKVRKRAAAGLSRAQHSTIPNLARQAQARTGEPEARRRFQIDNPFAQYDENLRHVLAPLPEDATQAFIAQTARRLRERLAEFVDQMWQRNADHLATISENPDALQEHATAIRSRQIFPERNDPAVREALNMVLREIDAAEATARQRGLKPITVRDALDHIVGLRSSMDGDGTAFPHLHEAVLPVITLSDRVLDEVARLQGDDATIEETARLRSLIGPYTAARQPEPEQPTAAASEPAQEQEPTTAEQGAEEPTEPETDAASELAEEQEPTAEARAAEERTEPEPPATSEPAAGQEPTAEAQGAEAGAEPESRTQDQPETTPAATAAAAAVPEPTTPASDATPEGGASRVRAPRPAAAKQPPVTDADIAAALSAWPVDELGALVASMSTSRVTPLHRTQITFTPPSGTGLAGTARATKRDLVITITSEQETAQRKARLTWSKVATWLRPGLTPARRGVIAGASETRERLQRARDGYRALGEHRHHEAAVNELGLLLTAAVSDAVAAAEADHTGARQPASAESPEAGRATEPQEGLFSEEDVRPSVDAQEEVALAAARRRIAEFAARLPDDAAYGATMAVTDLKPGAVVIGLSEHPLTPFRIGTRPPVVIDTATANRGRDEYLDLINDDAWVEAAGELLHADGTTEAYTWASRTWDDAQLVTMPRSLVGVIDPGPAPVGPRPIQSAPKPSAALSAETGPAEDSDVAVEEAPELANNTGIEESSPAATEASASAPEGTSAAGSVTSTPLTAEEVRELAASEPLEVTRAIALIQALREADYVPEDLSAEQIQSIANGNEQLAARTEALTAQRLADRRDQSIEQPAPEPAAAEPSSPADEPSGQMVIEMDTADSTETENVAQGAAADASASANATDAEALARAYRNWLNSPTAVRMLEEDRELQEETGVDGTNEASLLNRAWQQVWRARNNPSPNVHEQVTSAQLLIRTAQEADESLSRRSAYGTTTDRDLMRELVRATEGHQALLQTLIDHTEAADEPVHDIPEEQPPVSTPEEESVATVDTPSDNPTPGSVAEVRAAISDVIATLEEPVPTGSAPRRPLNVADRANLERSYAILLRQLGRINGSAERGVAVPAEEEDPSAAVADAAELLAALTGAQQQSAWYWGSAEWEQIRSLRQAADTFGAALRSAAESVREGLSQDIHDHGFLRTVDARVARGISHAAFLLARRMGANGQTDTAGFRAVWRLHRAAATRADRLLGLLPPGPGLNLLEHVRNGWDMLIERLGLRRDVPGEGGAESDAADGGRLSRLIAASMAAIRRLYDVVRGRSGEFNQTSAWRQLTGVWEKAEEWMAAAADRVNESIDRFEEDVETFGYLKTVWMRTVEIVSSAAGRLLDWVDQRGGRNGPVWNLLRKLHHAAEEHLDHLRGYLDRDEQAPLGAYDYYGLDLPNAEVEAEAGAGPESAAPGQETVGWSHRWPPDRSAFSDEWYQRAREVVDLRDDIEFGGSEREALFTLLTQAHWRAERGEIDPGDAGFYADWAVNAYLTGDRTQAIEELRRLLNRTASTDQQPTPAQQPDLLSQEEWIGPFTAIPRSETQPGTDFNHASVMALINRERERVRTGHTPRDVAEDRVRRAIESYLAGDPAAAITLLATASPSATTDAPQPSAGASWQPSTKPLSGPWFLHVASVLSKEQLAVLGPLLNRELQRVNRDQISEEEAGRRANQAVRTCLETGVDDAMQTLARPPATAQPAPASPNQQPAAAPTAQTSAPSQPSSLPRRSQAADRPRIPDSSTAAKRGARTARPSLAERGAATHKALTIEAARLAAKAAVVRQGASTTAEVRQADNLDSRATHTQQVAAHVVSVATPDHAPTPQAQVTAEAFLAALKAEAQTAGTELPANVEEASRRAWAAAVQASSQTPAPRVDTSKPAAPSTPSRAAKHAAQQEQQQRTQQQQQQVGVGVR